MPLYSARTTTSWWDGIGSVSPRISPRPGAATQNALAPSDTPIHSVAIRAQLQSADVPLRIRLTVAGAVGSLVLLGVAYMARVWLAPGVAYPWKATALFAALIATALAFVGQHPFPRLGPANHVTIIRAMLVALTAGLIGEAPTPRVAAAAIVATTVIAVLDGVDGWLARRSRMASA